MEAMDGTEKAPFREPGKTSPKGRLRQMKQEDGRRIGDPVHKYYSFPSEARDFSRGYFTQDINIVFFIYCLFIHVAENTLASKRERRRWDESAPV